MKSLQHLFCQDSVPPPRHPLLQCGLDYLLPCIQNWTIEFVFCKEPIPFTALETSECHGGTNYQSQNQLGSSSRELFTAHSDGESRIQNGSTGVTLLQVSSSLQSLSKSVFAICIKHFFLCTSCVQPSNKRDQLEESSIRWQKYIVLRKIISLLFFQRPFHFKWKEREYSHRRWNWQTFICRTQTMAGESTKGVSRIWELTSSSGASSWICIDEGWFMILLKVYKEIEVNQSGTKMPGAVLSLLSKNVSKKVRGAELKYHLLMSLRSGIPAYDTWITELA